jgi:hypothetical protein
MSSEKLKLKVYVSGKISGLPESEAMDNFIKGKAQLKELFNLRVGEIVTPFDLPHLHDQKWDSYMREDIIELMSCDAIFMLKDWRSSKGAILEHDIAQRLDFIIIYQP